MRDGVFQVSVIGQFIVVEGRHPEKQDEFGTIERHFIRKFNLPRGVQPEGVSSNLTSDGTLTIQALPLKPKDGSPARAIPIKIVSGPSDGAAPTTQDGKMEENK
ncbi:Hsp20/alpha crystallin family protein [Ancylostoma caninum]|uniref:Hsp20/alpha crystallin family protein n=1 Tax=Ancylostoma caninum TaxID=29170 RepID=A0A368FE86_ANCCA|nr:Hsp20/alpha crystallin family protein [Ancylostoma caninum]